MVVVLSEVVIFYYYYRLVRCNIEEGLWGSYSRIILLLGIYSDDEVEEEKE